MKTDIFKKGKQCTNYFYFYNFLIMLLADDEAVQCGSIEVRMKKGLKILDHPAYSPNLALSEYHQLPQLKEHLKG